MNQQKSEVLASFIHDTLYQIEDGLVTSEPRSVRSGPLAQLPDEVLQHEKHTGRRAGNRHSRVVFNTCGNKYRLVVWINCDFYTIYIRFVGTHKEYDEIDAQTI